MSGNAPLLGPIAQLRAGRFSYRFIQLVFGLWLFGFTMAMLVESGLGLDPWDVLHEGLAQHVPLSFGQTVIAVSLLVLLLWLPLKQMPGLGTVLNAVLVGLAADGGLALMDQPEAMWGRVMLLIGGVVGNGLASALYIGAHFGSGPRDGLWLGLSRTTGLSTRRIRTVLEVSVLISGWLLGGTVGVGTVFYALTIGFWVQLFTPMSTVRLSQRPPSVPRRDDQ